MPDSRLDLRRDERILRPNQMDAALASAFHRALLQCQGPAHVRIMNASRNARGTITAITNQNAMVEIFLFYRAINIKTAQSADKGIIDVKGNK